MESIIIIMIGLIFSVLSKSVKDKKEMEKERKKRREQLKKGEQQSFESYDKDNSSTDERKQRSLREIFVEEYKNLKDDDEGLGEVFRKTFRDKNPSKEEEMQTSMDTDYISEDRHQKSVGSHEGRSMEHMPVSGGDYVTQSEVSSEASKIITKTVKNMRKDMTEDNGQYNPFSKSMNRKDVIRGIIFSEVLSKPKSLRDERRSMRSEERRVGKERGK